MTELMSMPARLSRSEAVARRVEQEIFEGGYRGGERLGSKHDFKTRFGVASGTVSEALRILDGRGLVETRPGPGGGVFVAVSRVRFHMMVLGFKASDAPFDDFLAVRDGLESLVCAEAMDYRTGADVEDLRRILDEMESKLNEPVAFLRANWQLHRRIAQVVRNAPLKLLYLTLMDLVEANLESAEPAPSLDLARNWLTHERLVSAIAGRDEEALKTAIRRHGQPHRTYQSRPLMAKGGASSRS